MTAPLTITMKPKGGSKKLQAFVNQSPAAIKKGLRKAGSLLLKDWVKKVSGAGFVRNPGRSSDYPGVLSGSYFAGLTLRMDSTGAAVMVGPNVDYAIYHESEKVKKYGRRPVVPDVWRDSGEEALDEFQKEIARPLGV